MKQQGKLSFLAELLPPKKHCVLLGVGNELCQDDFVGMAVVQALRKLGDIPGFLAVEGGSAPENTTGLISAFRPDTVLVVDAAFCGLQPGDYAVLSPDAITGTTFSTHMLPLPVTLSYLEAVCDCETVYLGIQPVSVEQGLGMHAEVEAGIHRLLAELTALLQAGTQGDS